MNSRIKHPITSSVCEPLGQQLAPQTAPQNSDPALMQERVDFAAQRQLLTVVLPRWVQHIELARSQTEAEVDGITAHLIQIIQQLRQTVELSLQSCTDAGAFESLRDSSQALEAAISGVILGLQFQDRTSQMLTHVMQDIDRLAADVAGGAQSSAEQWLRNLERTFTTREEHQLAQGTTAPPDDDASSVTFF